MAQTFEQILAAETARDAEQRATLAELRAREATLSEDERSIVETLEFQIRFNDEHGLADIARAELAAQGLHDEYKADRATARRRRN